MVSRIDPLLIDGYLVRAAECYPDELALADRTRQLSYAELDEQVTRFANGLIQLGVAYGDRVALLTQNSIEMAVALLAAPRIGAIAAPINIRLSPAEAKYILADIEPAVVIADAPRWESHPSWPSSLRGVVLIGDDALLADLPDAREAVAKVGYDACLARAGSTRPEVDVDARDAAYILYTSGTTGKPKGAVLAHAGYVANSTAILNALRMSRRDELRHIGVPMFHSGGLNSLLQQVVLGGSALITEPGGLSGVELVDLWASHGVFTAFLTPTQWQQVCDVPDLAARKLQLGRLVWGSSNPPPEVLQRMQESFAGLPVYANFGMTETSGTTFSLAPEYALSKIHTVGKAVGPIQVRSVDEKMCDVPPGQVGEIVYQGPPVLREYWHNEEATENAFAGGWFHSGDLGYFDDDGFLVLVGRIKDMIVSGGENIYSSEVEAAVETHPKVAEVVVVGVPHPKWVETPRAVVVASDPADPPTLAELQDHIGPILASYKKPTSLEVVASLPRNTMGKLLRSQVKEEQLARDGTLG